jgi:hypothetical protein
MTWKRYNLLDAKDDWRVIPSETVRVLDLWPCADCGNRVGTRSFTWAGNIKRRDVRIYRGGRAFHYVSRRVFSNPESWQIQRGWIQLRCGRYITQPSSDQIKYALSLEK